MEGQPSGTAVRSVAESQTEFEALHALAERLDSIRQDTPNGGRWSRKLRQWQPWLMLFVSAIAIPTCLASILYLVDHRENHRDIEEFMEKGGRVYSSTGDSISTAELIRQMESVADERIKAQVPPPQVTQALEANTRAIEQLNQDVQAQGRELSALGAKVDSLSELVIRLNNK